MTLLGRDKHGYSVKFEGLVQQQKARIQARQEKSLKEQNNHKNIRNVKNKTQILAISWETVVFSFNKITY